MRKELSAYISFQPSRFNASAAPFVSQQHRFTASNMMQPKDTTPSGSLSTRQLPIPVHMSSSSPHHYSSYDSPITSRSAGMARGIFNVRYPMAPPPSPLYGFDNDLCRMVSVLVFCTNRMFGIWLSRKIHLTATSNVTIASRTTVSTAHATSHLRCWSLECQSPGCGVWKPHSIALSWRWTNCHDEWNYTTSFTWWHTVCSCNCQNAKWKLNFYEK